MGENKGNSPKAERELDRLRAEAQSLRAELAATKKMLADIQGGAGRDTSTIIQLNDELEQRVTQRTAELQAANLELAREVAERKRQAASAEQQRQLLAVTLASIGDAVIVTDVQGRVTFLNAEAERLTGWGGAAAQGQPLPAVFRIVNEETRQTVENPVDKVLRLGTVVGLANHTVLIARDGTETPIDDSAALIRERDGTAYGVVLVFRDFSQQKAAEKALRESEERFRTMADAMPQLAWTAQPDGYIHWYNRRWYEYTGTTPQRMEGWGWQSVHDPAALPGVIERWKASLATGEPFDMEFPLRGADGRFRTFLTRVMPLKDAAGRVVQWFGTNTDVQEIRQATEALRESEARLTFVLDGIHAGAWDLDLVDHTAHRSLTHDRIFGYETLLPEWTYEMFLAHVVPDDRDLVDQQFRQTVAAGQDWDFECRIVRRDQAIRWIWAAGRCRSDAGGKPKRLVGIVQDITQGKQAEEALRQRERLLQDVIDGSTAPIFLKDREGKFITINASLEKMLGMSRQEIKGKTDYDIVPKELADYWRSHDSKVMETGKAIQIEEVADLRDGHHVFLADKFPLVDSAGQVYGIGAISHDITARKQAEEALLKGAEDALRLSEQEFRSLAEAMPQIVWATRADGWNIYFNQQWADYTGMTMEESYGHGWNTPFHPDDKHRAWEAWQRATQHNERYSLECRLRRADGAYRWWLIRGEPMLGPNGAILKWFGTCTDIEDLKRGEAALREANDLLEHRVAERTAALRTSEERFRAMFDRHHAVKLVIEPETGAIVDANAAAARFYGYSRERLCALRISDLNQLPPDQVAAEMTKATAEQGGYFVFPHRLASGEVRWVEVYSTPVETHGRPLLYSIIHDITDRKQAEEALRASERLYRAIGESINYGIWICDAQGRNTYASESFLKLMGITQEQCSGLGWADVLHPDDVEATIAAWKQCVQTGGPWYREHRYRGADGQYHPILACGVAVRNERGEVTAWAGINLDINQLKRTEDDLKAAKVSAEQAKAAAETANQAKDHFLAVLSHELRTPLNPALMAATILEGSPQLPPGLREDVSIIRRNVELEARLIDDMLDLTRIARGKLTLNRRIVDVREVVRHAVETCHAEAMEKGLVLEVTLPEEPLHADVDPARMQQVFWNLLKNAVKFTPQHGQITVTAAATDQGGVRVQVSDTGKGIEPDALTRIFDAFEQGGATITKRYGGLGLGLAICEGLVGMHDGCIAAASDGPGKGATFIVELPPLAQRQGDKRTGRQGAGASVSLSPCPPVSVSPSVRILLVEDHESTAVMTARLLRSFGHQVTTADSVKSALDQFAQQPFDLVISDLGLPDGSGQDLLRQLLAHRLIPAIALSGYGMDSDIEQSLQAGFSEHLIKPINVTQLEAAIGRALGRIPKRDPQRE